MTRNKLILLAVVAFAFLFLLVRPVTFIHHPQPEEMTSSPAYSPDVEKENCWQDENGQRACVSEEVRKKINCRTTREIPEIQNGVSPAYPIFICFVDRSSLDYGNKEMDYFYVTGGMLGAPIRYVAYIDGEFVLIKSEDEFRKVFAPITSPEEALAFTLAFMNVDAYYGLEYNLEYVYYIRTIEDTYVLEKGDGYLVHVFYREIFGCGPRNTYAVDVKVTRDGHVSELSRKAIFRNRADDGMCVD